jgi:hypothetical protein
MASTHLSAAPGERREADEIETEDANWSGAAPSAKFRGTEPNPHLEGIFPRERLRSHRSPSKQSRERIGSAPLPRLSKQTHGKIDSTFLKNSTTIQKSTIQHFFVELYIGSHNFKRVQNFKAMFPIVSQPGFFLPTVEFLPLRSGNGSYRGIPRCTAKYRSNSNFKPKPLETASSNGMERYTAV